MNDQKRETLKQNLWTSPTTKSQEDPDYHAYSFKKKGCPFPETKEFENPKILKYGPVRIHLKNLQRLEKISESWLDCWKRLLHTGVNSCRWNTPYFAAEKKKSPLEPRLAIRGITFNNFLGLMTDKLLKGKPATLLLKNETTQLP